MGNKIKLTYFSLLYFFLRSFSSSNNSSNFEFQMDFNIPDNGILTLMEETFLNFTFNTTQFRTESELFITIVTLNSSEGGATNCKFSMDCSKKINNKTCRCLSPGGPYLFIKTVNRSDDKAIYMWSAEDKYLDKFAQRNVTFNVTYPSRVTKLIVDDEDNKSVHHVPRNESFTVECHWENGNPPTIPQLFDNEGKELKNTTNNGSHMIGQHSVPHCYITEVIKCEAYGSEMNLSAKVLAKCPPQFDRDYGHVQTVNGENAVLSFRLHVHTPTITKCGIIQFSEHLTTYSSAIVDSHYKDNNMNVDSVNKSCTNMSEAQSHVHECWCQLTGTVPNLTLHVYFRNLVESDSGLWLLHLSNDIGSDDMKFNIIISQMTGSSNDVNDVPMLVGIIGGIVILTLIAVIIRVVSKQKETRLLEPRSDVQAIDLMVIGNDITYIAGQTDIVKPALCAYEDVVDMMPLNRNCSRSAENMISRARSNCYAEVGVASATGRQDGSETDNSQANLYNTLATERQVGRETNSSQANVYNTLWCK